MTATRFAVTSGLVLTALAAAGCSKRKQEQAAGKASETVAGSAAAQNTAVTAGGSVRIDGSSTVFLLSQAVAEDYGKAGLGDAVVAASGTGGGFKKLCRGELDIAGASRPIKPEEVELCKQSGIDYIELPVAYDGIALVVSKDNTWAETLTVAELKKMWAPEAQGAVSSWHQVRADFPEAPLKLFGAGVDSGTYDCFTQAIVSKEHSSRGDYTASENDNVIVSGVAGDKNALGFFGFAYYEENKDKLKVIAIDDEKAENGAGPIVPDAKTIADGTYQPLSRPLFIYVSATAAKKASVEAFVSFYLKEAKNLAAEVGYVPLPASADGLLQKRWADKKLGSLFAGQGSKVGVTIENLLAAEGQ